MTTEPLKLLTIVKSWAEAALIEGLLKDAGIECITSADDAGGLRPDLTFIRGIRILCFESDQDRARELLKAVASPQTPMDADDADDADAAENTEDDEFPGPLEDDSEGPDDRAH